MLTKPVKHLTSLSLVTWKKVRGTGGVVISDLAGVSDFVCFDLDEHGCCLVGRGRFRGDLVFASLGS